MRHLTRRRWVLVVLGLAAIPAVIVFGNWRDASNRGGQLPAEPFRIAGNFYYVGATDVSAFLITGPEGHIVLDAGYPTCWPRRPIRNKRPTASAASACCGASPPTSG